MEGVFGVGHPVTAVGDPDQNIYAWRGASLYNLLDFPIAVPLRGRPAGREAPALHEFPLRRADPGRRRHPHRTAARRAAPRPREGVATSPAQRRGRGARSSGTTTSGRRRRWIADRDVALHEGGAAWSDMAVLCRTSRLFQLLQRAFGERGIPVEILGLAGLLKLPEVVEVLAYARAVHDPTASVALARILLGPALPRGVQGPRAGGRWAKSENCAVARADEDDDEANAVPVRRGAGAPGRGRGSVATRGARGSRSSATSSRALRVEARKPGPRVPGRGDPAHGHPRRARRRRRPVAAASAPEPRRRSWIRCTRSNRVEGELTLRAFLDYVDAGGAARQAGMGTGPAHRRGLREGHDDPRGQGPGVRPRLRAGLAHGLLPNPSIQQNPAERGTRWTSSCAATPTSCRRSTATSARSRRRSRPRRSSRNGAPPTSRSRARAGRCGSAAALVRREREGEGSQHVLRGAGGVGRSRGPGRRWTAGTESRRGEPHARVPGSDFVRDWPGPARPDDADELFPHGLARGGRRGVAEASAACRPPLVDALARRGPGVVRARWRRPARARAPPARARSRRGRAPAPSARRRPSRRARVIDYARARSASTGRSVRPLPRFSGPAARIGTEIHRWIERRASGQGQLLEVDDAPDLTDEELAGDPGRVERLRQAFLDSRFADRDAAVRRARVPVAGRTRTR